MSHQNPRLLAALSHARHGRSVLPVFWTIGGLCACGNRSCSSPAKHPISSLAPRGVKHATTSLVVIHAWWEHAPLANPAIATGEISRLTVLDIDGDKGGYDTVAELERTHTSLPK